MPSSAERRRRRRRRGQGCRQRSGTAVSVTAGRRAASGVRTKQRRASPALAASQTASDLRQPPGPRRRRICAYQRMTLCL